MKRQNNKQTNSSRNSCNDKLKGGKVNKKKKRKTMMCTRPAAAVICLSRGKQRLEFKFKLEKRFHHFFLIVLLLLLSLSPLQSWKRFHKNCDSEFVHVFVLCCSVSFVF